MSLFMRQLAATCLRRNVTGGCAVLPSVRVACMGSRAFSDRDDYEGGSGSHDVRRERNGGGERGRDRSGRFGGSFEGRGQYFAGRRDGVGAGRDESFGSGNRSFGGSFGGGQGGGYSGHGGGGRGGHANHREQRNMVSDSDYSTLNAELKYTTPPELQFADIGALHATVRSALKQNYGYELCTPVQASVMSRLPCEKDMIVQARTGTGKTLAYLLPAFDRIVRNAEANQVSGKDKPSRVLILAPTRELALQVAEEARRLVRGYRRSVVSLVGGESRSYQLQALGRRNVDIIVGTPGRLIDFLQSDRNFKTILADVNTIVLDEADRMLEIGFKQAVIDLAAAVPDNAQRLMFSATYPRNVEALVGTTMRPGYTVINTVSPDEASTATSVDQKYLVCDMMEQMAHLHNILVRGKTLPAFKVMVFVATTRAASMYGDYFAQAGFGNVLTLHSDKDQRARSSAAAAFRAATTAVLFTTDVSARGVDYPGVDLVVQIGLPTSPEQYVHRIGRTGRAGKTGEAISFLAPFESNFINDLKGLPVAPATIDAGGRVCVTCLESVTDGDKFSLEASRKSVRIRADSSLIYEISRYFSSSMGFYSSKTEFLKRAKVQPRTVTHSLANFVKALGLERLPPINSAISAEFHLRTD